MAAPFTGTTCLPSTLTEEDMETVKVRLARLFPDLFTAAYGNTETAGQARERLDHLLKWREKWCFSAYVFKRLSQMPTDLQDGIRELLLLQ